MFSQVLSSECRVLTEVIRTQNSQLKLTALRRQIRLQIRFRRQLAPLFFREEGVENVMRHQRRIRTVHAVLEKHDSGNFRLVAGCEEYEPAVVAEVLRRLAR